MIRRLAHLLVVAAILALPASLAVARPVAACSCVGPQPLAAYARDGSSVLAATVGPRDAQGYPIAVTRWFAGPGAAPVVRLSGDFGDGASCGVSEPAVGTSWIWVAWRQPEDGSLRISICSPFAQLNSPEGAALLAEAEQAFAGGVATPAVPPASPESPGAPLAVDPVVVAIALVVVAGTGVLAGAVLVGRARRSV